MTLAPEATLADCERRVRAAFDTDGRLKLSADEQAARLNELRRELRKLQTRQELELRQREAAGATVTRTQVSPAMFLRTDADLLAVAQGREVAA